VPVQLQQRAQRSTGIRVVIDDENAVRAHHLDRGLAGICLWRLGARQVDRERRATPEPFATGGDPSAVHADEFLHHGQTDSETSL